MTETESMIQARGKEWLFELDAAQRSNLVRLTAAYGDNHVSWQVVVTEEADEDEIEEYRCIFTEVLADFSTATGDEEFFRVRTALDAATVKPLAIAIFP